MSSNKEYRSIPLSFNRKAVIASATVTKEKNTIHAVLEIDITEPRRRIKELFETTGEKLSLTAYIVTCLARAVNEHPHLNSFISGRKQYFFSNVTISVMVERETASEKFPEPLAIQNAQAKTCREIHNEIKTAQTQKNKTLGALSENRWFRFIPSFLLKTFIRLADKNVTMAQHYGKIAVTAVGMFSKEAVWFIPHGSATVLLTVGSIDRKVVERNGAFESREHLCLTASFDHNIVDGAPAARFVNRFAEIVKSGELIEIQQQDI